MLHASPETLSALEKLAMDLRGYLGGQRPDAEELSEAPLLTDWRIGHRVAIALHGSTSDHPVLQGVRNVATSELYALDPNLRWARTFSRLYRLGVARADLLN